MTKTKQKPIVKRIQQLDLSILWGLYNLRAMSTHQVRRRYNLSPSYVYKKLEILRNTGWIKTEPINGFTRKQRRQGSYHRISETGIACLKGRGYTVERSADDLRTNKRHLPYLLHANDIFIDLEPFGWTMQDSRAVKRKYHMNRGNNLQGILKSPNGNEFIFYVLMESTTEKTLARIASEIASNSKIDRMRTEIPTSNYIIFVKGQKAYQQVVSYFYSNKEIITTTQQLKVMPTTFAKMYLSKFYDQQKLFDFLLGEEIYDITERALPGLKKSHKGLSTIVRHNGEEKYLVNLLDSDLIKIFDMHAYRKEKYLMDGRKILTLTTNNLLSFHAEMLKPIQHAELYPIDYRSLFK